LRNSDDPQVFWDAFDVETSALAAQLVRQLRIPQARRRGFSGLIGKFDKQWITLHNALLVMERAQRRALKGPERESVESANIRLLRMMRRRLHMMKRISEAMTLVSKGKPRPLYPPLRKKNDVEQTQAFALDTAMAFLHRLINPNGQSEEAKDLGCFSDIPLSSAAFIAHAHAALRVAMAQKRPEPLRFVDVGCGGGMKVLLAAEMFEQAEGYDFDPNYVAAAKKAVVQMNLQRCRIFEANALSFEEYENYDVIYFYQPMSDSNGLEVLEERIARQARPGTILIAPYLRFVQRAETLNCGRVEGAIFVTGTSQKEADALRVRAERIGPQMLRPGQVVRGLGVDWMRGLVLACAVNGYVPDRSI
jgi:SAM-dependent methyltransferase